MSRFRTSKIKHLQIRKCKLALQVLSYDASCWNSRIYDRHEHLNRKNKNHQSAYSSYQLSKMSANSSIRKMQSGASLHKTDKHGSHHAEHHHDANENPDDFYDFLASFGHKYEFRSKKLEVKKIIF